MISFGPVIDRLKNDINYLYNFSTDDPPSNGFDLVITVRGLRNSLMQSSFQQAKKIKGVSGDLDSVNSFRVPEFHLKSLQSAISKDFKKLRRMLESKNDIEFKRWEVRSGFFKRNELSRDEWVCTIIYRGDYECSE